MGFHKGPQTLVYLRASVKSNFFLTVDAVLLCAAKKNGVESTRLAGLCQNLPWTTGPAKSPSLPAGSKKIAGLSSGDFRYLICCYMP